MMDDLDTLQMELETLLNCVVLRSLNLQRETAGMTEKVVRKAISMSSLQQNNKTNIFHAASISWKEIKTR